MDLQELVHACAEVCSALQIVIKVSEETRLFRPALHEQLQQLHELVPEVLTLGQQSNPDADIAAKLTALLSVEDSATHSRCTAATQENLAAATYDLFKEIAVAVTRAMDAMLKAVWYWELQARHQLQLLPVLLKAMLHELHSGLKLIPEQVPSTCGNKLIRLKVGCRRFISLCFLGDQGTSRQLPGVGYSSYLCYGATLS